MALGDRAKGILDLLLDPSKYDDRFEVRKIPKAKPRDQYFEPVVEPYQPNLVVPEIKLSDLEGRPYLSTMSDRTSAEGILTGIGDKELAYPINLTGGQDFMAQNPEMWASAPSPVSNIIASGRDLKRKYGADPVFMPWRMSPSGSDFAAEMTAGTMMSYAAKNMPKADKKALDKRIKEFVPDFVGVDSPAAPAQIQSQPDKLRKFIQQQIMDKQFRNRGGISLPQARLAIADKTQLNAPELGFQNVGIMDVDAGALTGRGNRTYPDAVGGEFLGRLNTDAGLLDLAPTNVYPAKSKDAAFGRSILEDKYGNVRDLNTSKGYSAARRSAEINPYGGLIDEKLLRNLESKGIKINANPFMTLVGVGLAGGSMLGSEEAEAGILSGTYKNVSQNIDQLDTVIDRLNSGKPLSQGDLLSGSEGATFQTPQLETQARVFDELRDQSQTYGEPVFDRASIGSRIKIAGRERVDGIARFSMPSAYQTELGRLNLNNPDMIEISPNQVGADLFAERINTAKQASRFGASVEAYAPDVYKGMRLFLTEDGGAGFALKPDGDLVSAFSDGSTKGVAPQLMLLGIEQGAKKLDAFDTVLPDLYSTLGFREAGRIKFDPEQAPADFDPAVFSRFNEGQPDISFMALDRGPATPLKPIYADDYSDAISRQKAAVRNPKADILATTAGAGLLGAGLTQSEDAEASFLGEVSKLGASRSDLKGMAEKMLSEGVDPQLIWKNTGWEFNVGDGKWRTELPNTETKINLPTDRTPDRRYAIEEFLDDPELLSQYDLGVNFLENEINLDDPFDSLYGSRRRSPLSNVAVVFNPEIEAGGAAYDAFTDTIYMPVKVAAPQEDRGAFLHELQHAIQEREGFSTGSSPDRTQKLSDMTNSFNQLTGDGVPRGQAAINKLNDKIAAGNASLQDYENLANLKEVRDKALKYTSQSQNQTLSPFSVYGNTIGEVEANNVMARDQYNLADRDRSPENTEFMNTQNYQPRGQQILNRGSQDDYDLGIYSSPNLIDDIAQSNYSSFDLGDNVARSNLDITTGYRKAIAPKKAEAARQYLKNPIGRAADVSSEAFARGVEGAAKMAVGAIGSVFAPDSKAYKTVTSSDSIFGDPSSDYEKAAKTVSEALEEYLLPAITEAVNFESDIGSISSNAVKVLTPVVEAYQSAPAWFKSEIGERVGYAALAAMSIWGLTDFGLKNKAKDIDVSDLFSPKAIENQQDKPTGLLGGM